MFTGTYALLMAEYNRWMNGKVYAACATLTDEERKRDRGAFFKSIHATLNHLLWGRRRLAEPVQRQELSNAATGQSCSTTTSMGCAPRASRWTRRSSPGRGAVTPEALAEPMTWTAKLYGFTQTHPRWVQVAQMFNHQTHHRGQVHAMLTAAGVDVGATDLPMLPILNQGSEVGGGPLPSRDELHERAKLR